MIIPFQDKQPDVEKALFIAENASVIGDVTLEENVGIWFGAVLRGDEGPIRVGKNSNVQDNSVVHMDVGDEVIIGEDVTIGHNCIIHGCTIGDGTLVGIQGPHHRLTQSPGMGLTPFPVTRSPFP